MWGGSVCTWGPSLTISSEAPGVGFTLISREVWADSDSVSPAPQVILNRWTPLGRGSLFLGGIAGMEPFLGWKPVVGTWGGTLASAPGRRLSHFSGADLGPSGEVLGVSVLPPGPPGRGCWGWASLHHLSRPDSGAHLGPWSETASSHFCVCHGALILCWDRSCRCPMLRS